MSRNDWRVLALGIMGVLTFFAGMAIGGKTIMMFDPMPYYPRSESILWIVVSTVFVVVAYTITVALRKPGIVPAALTAGMVFSPFIMFLMFVLFGGSMGLIASIEHTPGIDPDWFGFFKIAGGLLGLTVAFAAFGWFLLRPLHPLGRRLRRMPPMPMWPN